MRLPKVFTAYTRPHFLPKSASLTLKNENTSGKTPKMNAIDVMMMDRQFEPPLGAGESASVPSAAAISLVLRRASVLRLIGAALLLACLPPGERSRSLRRLTLRSGLRSLCRLRDRSGLGGRGDRGDLGGLGRLGSRSGGLFHQGGRLGRAQHLKGPLVRRGFRRDGDLAFALGEPEHIHVYVPRSIG